METTTATTALMSKSAIRASDLPSVGRLRPYTPRRSRDVRGARKMGASPVSDPGGSLSMFDPRPRPARAVSVPVGEMLNPLLPPVISEPPRRRRATGHRQVAVAPVASIAPDVKNHRSVIRAEMIGRRAQLTTRGYAAVVGAIIGGVALCSAVTVGQPEAAPVESTQVVARGGEGLEAVAERAAQGRDVQAVAESIRVANGLSDGEYPQAGEVLVVPGS